jgi:hypothetical protein
MVCWWQLQLRSYSNSPTHGRWWGGTSVVDEDRERAREARPVGSVGAVAEEWEPRLGGSIGDEKA